jgi:uncharacterized RDD family membrane protein YckC
MDGASWRPCLLMGPENPFQSATPSHSPFGAPTGPAPGSPQYNPYAAPQSDFAAPHASYLGEQQLLAPRGTRFLGAMLDGLIAAAFMIPPLFLFGGLDSDTGLIGLGAGALLIMAIQWYLIATTGQSIAKRVLGMKIVKVDGSDVNFVSGVILRVWVIQALGAVPLVGNFVGLANALMIFGQEQRCLHDYIAGTKVISV